LVYGNLSCPSLPELGEERADVVDVNVRDFHWREVPALFVHVILRGPLILIQGKHQAP